MDSQIKLIFALLLSISPFIIFTIADEEEVADCRKLMMVIAKKQLKVFGECSREMKANISDPAEFQKRIQCVVKCSMRKELLVDEQYQMSNATVQAFLDKHVPKVFHEIGHMFMDNCMTQFDGKFDVNDEYCLSYGDFIKCMQQNIGDVC